MIPSADAYEGVRPGQHYVYRAGPAGSVEEEILRLDGRTISVRVTRRDRPGGPVATVERTIPRDVAWFIKAYRPEVGLAGFGMNGYDAAYFRAMMASHPFTHDPLPQDVKGAVRVPIGGVSFMGTRSEGTWLARTVDRGCVEMRWTMVRSPRYPFLLEKTTDGVPVMNLTAIR